MYNLPYYKNKFNFEPENTPHADRPIGKRILLLYDASVHMFPCCRVFVQQQITDGVKVWLELKKNVPRRTAECGDNVLTEGKVV